MPCGSGSNFALFNVPYADSDTHKHHPQQDIEVKAACFVILHDVTFSLLTLRNTVLCGLAPCAHPALKALNLT